MQFELEIHLVNNTIPSLGNYPKWIYVYYPVINIITIIEAKQAAHASLLSSNKTTKALYTKNISLSYVLLKGITQRYHVGNRLSHTCSPHHVVPMLHWGRDNLCIT